MQLCEAQTPKSQSKTIKQNCQAQKKTETAFHQAEAPACGDFAGATARPAQLPRRTVRIAATFPDATMASSLTSAR
jgi:hypothetical protein